MIKSVCNVLHVYKPFQANRARIHNSLFFHNLWIGPISKCVTLHYSRLEILIRDKHYSLLDPFVSYAKNEVLRIHTQGWEGIASWANPKNILRAVYCLDKEVLLKGKAQYRWPPVLIISDQLYFKPTFCKTSSFNEEVNCTEPSPQLLFPACSL